MPSPGPSRAMKPAPRRISSLRTLMKHSFRKEEWTIAEKMHPIREVGFAGGTHHRESQILPISQAGCARRKIIYTGKEVQIVY